jgi:hypothetical protein
MEGYVYKVWLIERMNGWWEVGLWGKSTTLIQPVPGNTRPASAAQWRTREEALRGAAELLKHPVEVMRESSEVSRPSSS